MKRCECCERDVPTIDWDGLYSSCHDCAFCASLGHEPCCHGACKATEQASAGKEPSK